LGCAGDVLGLCEPHEQEKSGSQAKKRRIQHPRWLVIAKKKQLDILKGEKSERKSAT
jgi:hypothetical protein